MMTKKAYTAAWSLYALTLYPYIHHPRATLLIKDAAFSESIHFRQLLIAMAMNQDHEYFCELFNELSMLSGNGLSDLICQIIAANQHSDPYDYLAAIMDHRHFKTISRKQKK